MSHRIDLYQVVLALAATAAVSYLGVAHVLSGDAVAGMIASLVAFTTGAQSQTQQSIQRSAETNGDSK